MSEPPREALWLAFTEHTVLPHLASFEALFKGCHCQASPAMPGGESHSFLCSVAIDSTDIWHRMEEGGLCADMKVRLTLGLC